MKSAIIIIVIVVALGGGYLLYRASRDSGSDSSTSSSAVETNSVDISNLAFSPPAIVVNASDTVTFTNNDGTDHTITADDGSFDQDIASGQTVSITMANAGTVSYHCKIHPGMKGTIEVK